jgi:hypothetical protein
MANVGRTATKWIRFAISDNVGAPREIPIDSIGPVGFIYDEAELTGWQDAVKGYLTNHPDCAIDITGPFDTTAAAVLAASTVAPALSGSHTILAPLAHPTTGTTLPRGLWIAFGIRHYWTAAEDPAFGVASPSATSGYVLTKYVVEGDKYSARFVPFPGTIPAWGTAILIAYA